MNGEFMKKELLKSALLNSFGVYVYVLLVALFMTHANALLGTNDTLFSIVAFLILFVLSAGVVGGLVLGKPVILYLDGKKKDSVALVFYTLFVLFVLLILTLLPLTAFSVK